MCRSDGAAGTGGAEALARGGEKGGRMGENRTQKRTARRNEEVLRISCLLVSFLELLWDGTANGWLSSLSHLMFGVGWPLARHTRLVSSPSSSLVYQVSQDCAPFGGYSLCRHNNVNGSSAINSAPA